MATLNLVKGQKLSLEKQDVSTVFRFGAGWDVNKGNSGSFDVDLSVYFYDKDNKEVGILYFNTPAKKLNGIQLSEDNTTGEDTGKPQWMKNTGEDEYVTFDQSLVPANVDKAFVVANIYDAENRKQNFGMINNAFAAIYNDKTDREKAIAKFDLSEDFSAFSGIILEKVYRHNDEWKFQVISQGVNGNLSAIEKEVAKLL